MREQWVTPPITPIFLTFASSSRGEHVRPLKGVRTFSLFGIKIVQEFVFVEVIENYDLNVEKPSYQLFRRSHFPLNLEIIEAVVEISSGSFNGGQRTVLIEQTIRRVAAIIVKLQFLTPSLQ